MKSIAAIAATLLLAGGIAGCENDGPAERLGEDIDEATDDFRNGVEDACEDLKEGAGAKDTDC